MYIFTLLIFAVLASFIFLAFTKPVKLHCIFDSEKARMHVSAIWLKVIEAEANLIDTKIIVTVRFKSHKVASKAIHRGKKSSSAIFSALDLQDTRVIVRYGLHEPHLTGILCGAMEMLGTLIDIDDFEQLPEFMPEEEYLLIEAASKLNVGRTIEKYLRLKFNERKRRKSYEPV